MTSLQDRAGAPLPRLLLRVRRERGGGGCRWPRPVRIVATAASAAALFPIVQFAVVTAAVVEAVSAASMSAAGSCRPSGHDVIWRVCCVQRIYVHFFA